MKYYFAYGSNLSVRQMRQRCPGVKLFGTGYIPDYSLEFKTAYGDKAFATIDYKDGASVPIAVYEIEPSHERSLDYYEGVAGGHYHQINVTAIVNGQMLDGMVYVMRKQAYHKQPHPGYIAIISEGYTTHQFDWNIVIDAYDRAK